MAFLSTPSISSFKKTSKRKEVRFSRQINVTELQYQEADNYIEATINNAEEYTTNERNIAPHLQHNQNHLYNERWKSEANYMPSNGAFPAVPIRYNASLIDVYDIYNERWKSEANYMPSNDAFPTVPIRYNASLIDVYDIIDAVISIIE
jgi:hypothetical protein